MFFISFQEGFEDYTALIWIKKALIMMHQEVIVLSAIDSKY